MKNNVYLRTEYFILLIWKMQFNLNKVKTSPLLQKLLSTREISLEIQQIWIQILNHFFKLVV